MVLTDATVWRFKRYCTANFPLIFCLASALVLSACSGAGVESSQGSSPPVTGGSNPPPPSDTTKPTVTIASPATGSSTGNASISLSGTATDDVGVTNVIWRNSTSGANGSATGTSSWSVSSVPLQNGANSLVVTARDAAGNTATAQVTVTYTGPTQNNAVVSWDSNSESDLAGYRVYYGFSPGSYFQARGDGVQVSATFYTVTGLTSGQRYYFAVTAVDISGNESGFSNEVFKDIP